ncbi:hypothetical protein BY996DRAFT_2688341 [Phakopsora pachyrhizi]|nr:hypothetical protein BY996DRAFT_2688341 [Phakopsora pachyrhizi]
MRVPLAVISLGLLISMIEAMEIASSVNKVIEQFNGYVESVTDLTKMASVFEEKVGSPDDYKSLGKTINDLGSHDKIKEHIDKAYNTGEKKSELYDQIVETANRHNKLLLEIEKALKEGKAIRQRFQEIDQKLKKYGEEYVEKFKGPYPSIDRYFEKKVGEANKFKESYDQNFQNQLGDINIFGLNQRHTSSQD